MVKKNIIIGILLCFHILAFSQETVKTSELSFLSPLNFFIVIGAVVVALVFNKRQINKLVESKIATQVNRNKQIVREVIKNEEIDTRVRNELSFMVIVPTEDRRDYMENLFDKLKFGEKLKVEVREKFDQSDCADVFVFDYMHNKSKSFMETIADYVDRNKSLGVVLSDNHLEIVNENRDKLTAANSEFVLYARIMELGRFLYQIK